MEVEKWYYEIWRDKKYFDLWHVNHILAGCLLAGLTYFMEMSFSIALGASLIPMIWWEIYERKRGVKETWQNGVNDMLTGILGFVIIYKLYQDSTAFFKKISFTALAIIWIVLELW